MENSIKTKDSQLRAVRNYRLRHIEKVRETSRNYSRQYYSNPQRKEAHRKRMLDYYYKKKAQKARHDSIHKAITEFPQPTN